MLCAVTVSDQLGASTRVTSAVIVEEQEAEEALSSVLDTLESVDVSNVDDVYQKLAVSISVTEAVEVEDEGDVEEAVAAAQNKSLSVLTQVAEFQDPSPATFESQASTLDKIVAMGVSVGARRRRLQGSTNAVALDFVVSLTDSAKQSSDPAAETSILTDTASQSTVTVLGNLLGAEEIRYDSTAVSGVQGALDSVQRIQANTLVVGEQPLEISHGTLKSKVQLRAAGDVPLEDEHDTALTADAFAALGLNDSAPYMISSSNYDTEVYDRDAESLGESPLGNARGTALSSCPTRYA